MRSDLGVARVMLWQSLMGGSPREPTSVQYSAAMACRAGYECHDTDELPVGTLAVPAGLDASRDPELFQLG
ncbi:MAG: hypothetical protein ACK53E_03225 [Pseudanabaena sp.]